LIVNKNFASKIKVFTMNGTKTQQIVWCVSGLKVIFIQRHCLSDHAVAVKCMR